MLKKGGLLIRAESEEFGMQFSLVVQKIRC